MNMTMRKYRQIKGTAEDAMAWVKKTLMPVLKTSKDFRAHCAVIFDDGSGPINVYDRTR